MLRSELMLLCLWQYLRRIFTIAAGAVVVNDVPPFALMVGVPARRAGWMSKAGIKLDQSMTCPIDGSQYREISSDELELLEDA